jgi:hypothetical protein
MKRAAALILGSSLILGLSVAPVDAATRRDVKRPQSSPPAVAAVPVISCNTSYGAGSPPSPFVPHQLPTTSSVAGLSFYSNGRITVLGPSGWACGALVAADGGQRLDVYPPGKPDYSTQLAPKGAELVEVQVDYTGHVPGVALVCTLFPNSAGVAVAKESSYPCQKPASEKGTQLTSDVVTFVDAPGVKGSGTGSGGSLLSTGAAVYPQLSFGSTDSVNVSLLSCTLPKKDASLCKAIQGDYLVRNPPIYVPQSSG